MTPEPSMLVVVPSHKRLPLLRWSLLSVLRAGRDVTGRKRLLVVGNHPPGNGETARLLEDILRDEPAAAGWEAEFLGREVSMDPVDNWYGAILEHARDGETVFLHGDDDLMLPGGFSSRHEALQAASPEAPVLICYHLGGLIFRDGERCHLPQWQGKVPEGTPPVRHLGPSDGVLGNAPFIGNHAYRFGPAFRRALERTFAECDRQSWLPRRERMLMLPYYLPFVALADGSPVLGLDRPCEIRGNGLEEIITAPYRNANWSNGFLYGIALDLMHQGVLGGLAGMERERAHYARITAACYLSVMADGRLPAALKAQWREKVRPLLTGHTAAVLRGGLTVAGEISGLTRLRLRASFLPRPTGSVERDLLDVMHPPQPRLSRETHG